LEAVSDFEFRPMIHLNFAKSVRGTLRVLCLGCHSDDIEIGCGGTLLRLVEDVPDSEFHWVVLSGSSIRDAEARRGVELFAGHRASGKPLVKTFPDGFMPFVGAEVKTVFEELKSISPDVIFTHSRRDAHQDHRLIAELTWNTFRDHLILEYEIPKYDGDLGQPNVFVPLSKDQCQRKIRYLLEAFPSQRTKRWFQEDTFLSLMRLRGMECNAPSGYAEAFYSRKLVLCGMGESTGYRTDSPR
jgi:LmbE family N-acetylglucosaminyl deacetylase